MDERFQELERLFGEALEIAPESRDRFVEEACADDQELKRRLQALLGHSTESGQFVADAIDEAARDSGLRVADAAGQWLGPYRLECELGRGGMGEVWLAQQSEPIERRVALKLIKRGMDSDEIVSRFMAERRALALMDHPAVAKVFEAGAAPDGRPYFVMEYVNGLPITQHCEQEELDVGARLRLFLQVCEGVQHAHQKALLHRDLKPSNVLVAVHDGRPQCKIIDFGIAKAMGPGLIERTLPTQHGVLVGTPAYMSPEQAGVDPEGVDTRSDVYSLGALLYEILVGDRALLTESLADASFEEIRRRILEDEPALPSARVRERPASVGTGVEPRHLAGDLDWITMKAMAKDRERRYGSVAELAEDLRRYLRDDPVSAGPPSRSYRARKFVRRHRLGVGLVGAAVAVLVAFAVTASVQNVRIAAERDRADREAETAGRVSDFLISMFDQADPIEGESLTVREVVDRAAERIPTELRQQPEVQANLMDALGRVYRSLAAYDSAERLLEDALSIRLEILGDSTAEVGQSHNNLALVYSAMGDYERTESHLLDALEINETALGPGAPEVVANLTNLGNLYRQLGRFEEAEQVQRRALSIQGELLGDDHPDLALLLHNLGRVLTSAGHYAAAEDAFREATEIAETSKGPAHPTVGFNLGSLAAVLTTTGRYEEAEEHARRSLDILRKALGDEHPHVGNGNLVLGRVYLAKDEPRHAEPVIEQALEIYELALSADHPSVAVVLTDLGLVSLELRQYDRAEALFSRALRSKEADYGAEHAFVVDDLLGLASVYRHTGRLDQADALVGRALQVADRGLVAGDRTTAAVLLNLVDLRLAQSREAEAEPHYQRALSILERVLGPDHGEVLELRESYGSRFQ